MFGSDFCTVLVCRYPFFPCLFFVMPLLVLNALLVCRNIVVFNAYLTRLCRYFGTGTLMQPNAIQYTSVPVHISVLIFVLMCRSMGLDTRIVLNLDIVPLKPTNEDLTAALGTLKPERSSSSSSKADTRQTNSKAPAGSSNSEAQKSKTETDSKKKEGSKAGPSSKSPKTDTKCNGTSKSKTNVKKETNGKTDDKSRSMSRSKSETNSKGKTSRGRGESSKGRTSSKSSAAQNGSGWLHFFD
jgi:hypothetical protein